MAFAFDDTKDGIKWTGARTANTVGGSTGFILLGGKYAWGTSAPSTSTTLQVLLPDGVTYQAVIAAVTVANFVILDLPAGTYNVIFTATSDVAGFVQKIPYNPAY